MNTDHDHKTRPTSNLLSGATIDNSGASESHEGHAGQHANPISISLKRDDVGISYIDHNTKYGQKLSNHSQINLKARGGDGANGKIGKNGAKGRDGAHGISATAYTCGTNGGDGEPGQDGEPGSHGADGGNGADVTVSIFESDLALIPALYIDNRGGNGGQAGRHGRGGRGGSGGSGGHSYTHTEYVVSHSHGHHGHGGHTHTQPVVTFQPGGYAGSPGRDGRTPSTPLYHGKNGKPGQTNYVVTNNIGQTIYNQAFNLKAGPYSIINAQSSNINEFGSTFYGNFSLQNTADAMPSPAEAIPLSIEEVHLQGSVFSPGILAVKPGIIPGSIAAGASHNSESEPVVFTKFIPEFTATHLPYVERQTYVVNAINTVLKRSYTGAQCQFEMEFKFPVKIGDIQRNYAMTANETLTVPLSVVNISNVNLDGRQVELRFSLANESKRTLTNKALGLINPCEFLKRNVFETHYQVAFSADAEPSDTLEFNCDLYIQPLNDSQSLKLIQRQPVTVQLTQKYEKTSHGFTLVVNAHTSKEVYANWVNVLQQIAGNNPISVWNVDYQGKEFLNKPDFLAEQQDGTIIILNNRNFSADITQQNIFDAKVKYNCNLVLVDEHEFGAQLKTNFHDASYLNLAPASLEFTSVSDLISHLLYDNSDNKTYKLDVPGSYTKQSFSDLLQYTVLKDCFPNRHFMINTSALNDQILIRPLPSLAQVKINTLAYQSDPKEIVDVLNFSHKLRLVFDDKNAFQQSYADSIIKDLLKEQDCVRRSSRHGNIFTYLINRYRHDFTQELHLLQEMLDMYKANQQGMSLASINVLIETIASVQFYVEQHTSFWSRLLHFFFPLIKEDVNEATHELCDELAALLPPSKGIQGMDTIIDNQCKLLHIKASLEQFANPPANPGFFSRRPKVAVSEAARQWINVINGVAPVDSLQNHLAELKSSPLSKLYKQYEQIGTQLIHANSNSLTV